MKKLLVLLVCILFGIMQAQETITLYITDGNDDAYQLYRDPAWEDPTGEMFVEAENLFVGYTFPPAMYYHIGLRYQSVPIAPGSTIESAYIQFYAFEANDDTTGIRVRCELDPNPLPFSGVEYNISDRLTTNRSEFWAASEWQAFIPGPNQRTHDIRDVVQEVIDMEGWLKNNAMVFFFKGTNPGFGEDYPKAACSWEFGGEFYAPILTITYTEPAAVDEFGLDKSLKIFPNPVSENVNISFDDIQEGNYTFSIFDLQGKQLNQIYDGWLSRGKHHFESSAADLKVSKGVYLLCIRRGNHTVCRKIIFQ